MPSPTLQTVTDSRSTSYAQQQLEIINVENHHSLLDMFNRVCADKANVAAFSSFGKELTFADIDRLSAQLAAYFQHECALEKGDRIAIQLPNVMQYPVVAWAALRSGLIIVNTNPLYTEREMLHQFNDADVKLLVVLADFLPKACDIIHKTGVQKIIATELMDFIAHDLKADSFDGVTKFKGADSLLAALSMGKTLSVNPPQLTMNDVALLQYTGGTTGVAKGATLTQGNIFGGLTITRNFFKDVMVDREVVIAPMPLYHVYGFTMNIVSVFLFGGISVLIANPRDPSSIIAAMKQYQATGLAGVHTLFQALMDHPEFDDIDFSMLTGTIAGGTALVKEIAEHWKARTGHDIYEGYGLSETGAAFSCNIEGKRKLGTVGMAFENMQVKLIDELGETVPNGQAGELCVRGPQVMQGYWKRPAATEEAIDHDGWFRTGDVAEIDHEGFIKIVDRLKDMVIVSGFNVYPTEIESVVYGHPDIVECAVVGVPDDKTGEAVKLFIHTSNPNLTAQAVIEFCKKALTSYKVPKQIEFLDDLPKTPVGKILRRELR